MQKARATGAGLFALAFVVVHAGPGIGHRPRAKASPLCTTEL